MNFPEIQRYSQSTFQYKHSVRSSISAGFGGPPQLNAELLYLIIVSGYKKPTYNSLGYQLYLGLSNDFASRNISLEVKSDCYTYCEPYFLSYRNKNFLFVTLSRVLNHLEKLVLIADYDVSLIKVAHICFENSLQPSIRFETLSELILQNELTCSYETHFLKLKWGMFSGAKLVREPHLHKNYLPYGIEIVSLAGLGSTISTLTPPTTPSISNKLLTDNEQIFQKGISLQSRTNSYLQDLESARIEYSIQDKVLLKY